MKLGARSGGQSGLGLAVPAEPEELQAMGIDPIAAPPGDLGDGLADTRVFDVSGASAARAPSCM